MLDLEIRFLANRDPQSLLRAAHRFARFRPPAWTSATRLWTSAASLIEGLNRRYRRARRFYLFHRHRIYNDSEGRWMGWERKRGKLLDLNQLHARRLRRVSR